jgi:hypothetical protein
VATPAFGTETVNKQGGISIHPGAPGDLSSAPVWLIFDEPLGNASFGFDGSLSPNQITAAVATILSTPYLSGLSQYVGATDFFLAGTYVSNYGIGPSYSAGDINDVVTDAISKGGVPEEDYNSGVPGGTAIYAVFTPKGYAIGDAKNAAAYHNIEETGSFFPVLDLDYAPEITVPSDRAAAQAPTQSGSNYTTIANALDTETDLFSHELVESITDSDVQTGWQVTNLSYPSTAPFYQAPNAEICDNEAQLYVGYENGVLVQSYYSANTDTFVIPGATYLNLALNNGQLSIGNSTGLDPFGDTATMADLFTIGPSASGGVQITINDQTVTYPPGQITSISLVCPRTLNTIALQGVPAGVTSISIQGAGTTDLVAPSGSANTWHLTGTGSGTIDIGNQTRSVTYSGVTDDFGGGTDSFLFQGGSVPGNIFGATTPVSETLDYSSLTGPVSVNLSSQLADDIGGFFTNINNFVGSSSPADTLVANATWDITGPNSGTVNGAMFSSFENLTGIGAGDHFVFFPGGNIYHIVAGGGSALDYSNLAGPITVNLQTDTATAIGGTFADIANFIGSASLADTLVSPDFGGTWRITGPSCGTVDGGVTFSSFENLTGGGGADDFVFFPGGSVAGNIDGGGGSNTLDYSNLASLVTVNLQTDTATAIGGTFANIGNFVGNISQADTLVGPDATWDITGPSSGTVNGLTFSSFANLAGSAGNDQFVFFPGGSVAGNIDGGGGTNTLDYSNLTTPVILNLQSNTATGIGGTFANIAVSISGSGSNTFVGPNANTVWNLTGLNQFTVDGLNLSGYQSITGGSDNNRFVFQTGGGVSGSIKGGPGNNMLDYSPYVGNITVDLLLGSATGVGNGVSNVENVTGSIGNDMLVGDALPNVLIGGTGRNVIIGGGGGDMLVGGGGDNILIAGTTAYDANLTALTAIMAEWTRTDLSFEQRVAALNSNGPPAGALNGLYELNKKTVSDDGAADTLTGGGGLNWFFYNNKQDTLCNVEPRDHKMVE